MSTPHNHDLSSEPSSSRPSKLNINTVGNALRRQDIRPLIHLHRQLKISLAPRDHEILRHSHLSKRALRSDGSFVLQHLDSPAFTKIFQIDPESALPTQSKRDPRAWEDLQALASYWCDHKPGRTANPLREHAFYDAWMDKAKTGFVQQESMRQVVAGTYLIFRPSVLFPGRYVVGLLLIYVAGGLAVATYELNKLDTPQSLGPCPPWSGPQALLFEEEHHGYALRKSGCLMIRSWEESSGDEQVGVFSLFNDDDKKHTHVLDGHYMGVLSNNGPTSRTAVLLRQSDSPTAIRARSDIRPHLQHEPMGPLLEHLGMVTWEQLPSIVQARLSRAARSSAVYAPPTTNVTS
jgi:hypothetical protein